MHPLFQGKRIWFILHFVTPDPRSDDVLSLGRLAESASKDLWIPNQIFLKAIYVPTVFPPA